jgi:hypothetical protein
MPSRSFFSEPRIGRGFIHEDLQVVEVANLFAVVDVNPDVIRPSSGSTFCNVCLGDRAYGNVLDVHAIREFDQTHFYVAGCCQIKQPLKQGGRFSPWRSTLDDGVGVDQEHSGAGDER